MIGTVALVLMFVFEMVAMGYLGSTASQTSNGNTDGVTLQGNVISNVTISRYEPYVIVKGNDTAAIEAAKQALISSGVADYATQSQDGLIVSLKSSRNAPVAAAEFLKANATVLATAYVNMPSAVKVTGEGITTQAEGTGFSTQLKPVYEEGSRHEASFSVAVENGKVVGLGNFIILPRTFTNVSVVARLASDPASTYTVEVPWDSRALAKPFAVANNATYKEKSYIIVPTDLPSKTLSALSGQAFVTGAQQGVVSVRNDFADEGTAMLQLALLNITPEFPPSIASFSGANANVSAHALLDSLSAVNVTANIIVESKIRAMLPETIEADGANYATDGKTLLFDALNLPANITNVTLNVDFTAEEGKVVAVQDARLQ